MLCHTLLRLCSFIGMYYHHENRFIDFLYILDYTKQMIIDGITCETCSTAQQIPYML
jgi:hypothetical protein